MLPKKGQVIEFNFHGFGVVLQEETTVIDVNNTVITISDGEPEYQFCTKTGKCLNDNVFNGCKRTLSRQFLL